TLSARENIGLPALLDGRPRRWTNQKTDELLDALALTDRADHRPDALSGGEQQRVAIGRALVLEPTLLLADEPTGNLDQETSQQLWQLLADVAEQRQLTILMVTHEPAAAVHCRRAYLFRDGQIHDQLDTEGLHASDLASRYQSAIR
ncbi:MAG: ABC transporter ATP-binding protein, partial [Phycisphaeraceae bacterium]|nr:ABC transporter ATP-binding protein [Phycisphaeraceae bacterium]